MKTLKTIKIQIQKRFAFAKFFELQKKVNKQNIIVAAELLYEKFLTNEKYSHDKERITTARKDIVST